MAIIPRYLFRQLFVTMLAVSGVLVLIFMSGRFIKYLGEVAAGKWAADIVLAIMAYRMPQFLELIIPLSLFMAILLSYGRMYIESEMVVLRASGMGPTDLVLKTFVTALPVMILVGWMSLWVTPQGMQKVDELFVEQSRKTEFDMLAPGRFQALRTGGRVTYTESLSEDRRVLSGVFISEKDPLRNSLSVVVAKRGTQFIDPETGSRFLILHEGQRYEGRPGEADYKVIEFREYGVKIADAPAEARQPRDEAIPTMELMQASDAKSVALLQWRLSIPLLVPIVTLLAIPLSRVNPRQGRYFKLLPAMLLYISYLGLLIFARKQIEKGRVPAELGMWWVHGLYLIIALWLLYSESLRLWWKRRAVRAAA
ncbi:LPS export ABC transporter permease LptF [Hahella sp. SMD15-11]|uniref:Lipopolysaccharide export system permease protein LptF n=1 Tax=Thermohahella caldifontis TaxID=3142973 RepID=A0AB39UY62_9GAMM